VAETAAKDIDLARLSGELEEAVRKSDLCQASLKEAHERAVQLSDLLDREQASRKEADQRAAEAEGVSASLKARLRCR
jgi:hypothetical protein